MGTYGAANTPVERLIERAGMLTLDEAVDIYRAHAARMLIQGSGAERVALIHARRAATRNGLAVAYEEARHAAATAWRHALPDTQGPWLAVGAAIANAAGAMVIEDVLDEKPYQLLIGPWQQAMGTMVATGPGGMTPVGPGMGERSAAGRRRRIG
jgi:hypothetical protein